MKNIFGFAVIFSLMFFPAMAQVGPGGPGSASGGESSVSYMMSHTDVRLLSGKPQLMVFNGLDETIDSITCTRGSNTWVLVGPSPDKSVPRNNHGILSGAASIIDVDGWSSYCPNGMIAHTQTMDVKGETNVPNDVNSSTRVAFWKRNAR
jgi:hypothetical protein